MEYSPYTSVWGPVTDVRQAPRARGLLLVTIAGQVLRLQRTTDDGFEKLGLLRLSKKRSNVFLIVCENRTTDRHSILAGWKNPPDLFVRTLQPFILEEDESLHKLIAAAYPPPVWKDFDMEPGWDD